MVDSSERGENRGLNRVHLLPLPLSFPSRRQ